MTNSILQGMQRHRAMIALLLLAVATNAVQAQQPAPDSYVLGVSDVLTVSIWKNIDLTATVPVRPDGNIHLPLVGEVRAAGQTPAELQKLLAGRYAEFVTVPAVTVLVTAINSRKVYLIGQVNAPGAYDLLQPLKLLQMLATAGGLTDFAKKDQITVLRIGEQGDTRISVSVTAIMSGKRLGDNILLQPGDTIIIP